MKGVALSYKELSGDSAVKKFLAHCFGFTAHNLSVIGSLSTGEHSSV